MAILQEGRIAFANHAIGKITDYTPDKTPSLLLQLHGIAPETLAGRRTTWTGMGTREWVDANAPVIVAQPFGRINTFYRGIGEVDVLEVAEEVQRRFSVDTNRVFIMGHSMGGAGSFTVGLHCPDRFGSITHPLRMSHGSRMPSTYSPPVRTRAEPTVSFSLPA